MLRVQRRSSAIAATSAAAALAITAAAHTTTTFALANTAIAVSTTIAVTGLANLLPWQQLPWLDSHLNRLPRFSYHLLEHRQCPCLL